MPPYTVHAFKPAEGAVAAPQISDSGESTVPPNDLSSVPSSDSGYDLDGFLGQSAVEAEKTYGEGKISEQTMVKPTAADPKEPEPKAVEKPSASADPLQEAPAEKADVDRPKRRAPFTKRSTDGSAKKSPITQRLGEYTFSLFEELGGSQLKPNRSSIVKSKKENNEDNQQDSKNKSGGNEMPFNFNGSKDAERKMSFSEKFLNRNGKKAAEKRSGENGEIVQNGTPAQRRFVDASEYDEWVCPGCGSTNQEYVGVCSCGERKPRTKW